MPRPALPGIATHYSDGKRLLCGRPLGGMLTTRILTQVNCKVCVHKLFGGRKGPEVKG